MEESKPTKKVTKKVEAPKEKTMDEKIFELYNQGFNINQIGSMLYVHTQYIKQLIENA